MTSPVSGLPLEEHVAHAAGGVPVATQLADLIKALHLDMKFSIEASIEASVGVIMKELQEHRNILNDLCADMKSNSPGEEHFPWLPSVRLSAQIKPNSVGEEDFPCMPVGEKDLDEVPQEHPQETTTMPEKVTSLEANAMSVQSDDLRDPTLEEEEGEKEKDDCRKRDEMAELHGRGKHTITPKEAMTPASAGDATVADARLQRAKTSEEGVTLYKVFACSDPPDESTSTSSRTVSKTAKSYKDATWQILHIDTVEGELASTWWKHMFFVLLDRWDAIQEPPRTGCLATLVAHSKFGQLSIAVIVCNAGFMAYVANHDISNPEGGQTEFIQSAEIFFLTFFLLELVLKLVVHRGYFFVNDMAPWNNFDVFLVCLSVYDFVATFSHSDSEERNNMIFMRTLRMFKVAKMLRMARVLNQCKELRLMIVCIASSMWALLWVFIMISFILYIFALFFVQGFAGVLRIHDTLDDLDRSEIILLYGSVRTAMLTLFQCVSGGTDWAPSHMLMYHSGSVYAYTFVFFIGFFNFAVFNILTGMFVEQAMKNAEPDHEQALFEQRKAELEDQEDMMELCRILDTDGNGMISVDEIRNKLKTSRGRHLLRLRGLDPYDAEIFFKMLAHASGSSQVKLEMFTQCVMRMKGFAKAMDVQLLYYENKLMSQQLQRLRDQVITQLNLVNSALDELRRKQSVATSQPRNYRYVSI